MVTQLEKTPAEVANSSGGTSASLKCCCFQAGSAGKVKKGRWNLQDRGEAPLTFKTEVSQFQQHWEISSAQTEGGSSGGLEKRWEKHQDMSCARSLGEKIINKTH